MFSYSVIRGTGLLLALLATGVSVMAAQPIDVTNRKQLFIDDRFVESRDGLVRRVNQPVKAGPVLTPETQIEAGAMGGQSVSVMEDPTTEGRYLMYYTAHLPTEQILFCNIYCRAVSEDGIHWRRERVGLFEFGGSLDNNVVASPVRGPTVFVDPIAADGYPFKMVSCFAEQGDFPYPLHLFRSRDGLKWERLAEPALTFNCDTQNQCFYDSRLNKYVAYVRGWDPGRVAKRTETDDLLALPWPFEPQPGVAKTGKVYNRLRKELPTVLERDAADPPSTQVYNPAVHLYPYAEDVYVAFPSMYRAWGGFNSYGRDQRGKLGSDGLLDVQLAVSRDGVHFTRFHEPYVGLGRIGEVDGGMVFMAIGMLRRGDDLYQYYVAHSTTHGVDAREEYRKGLPREAIIRLVQRLDGFVSLDAGPEGGELVTPVITFTGSRLQLNIDCSAMGEAWVELQDENGQPIPGFSESEAVSVDRNGVAQEVWWQRGPDISSLVGRRVKMRIRLRSAKLYAFQFVQ